MAASSYTEGNEASKLPALSTLDEFLEHKYDFIIIGGGTAGLVVAARLTENSNVQVGVLEAGTSRIGNPMIMTPALYTKIMEIQSTTGFIKRSLKDKHLLTRQIFEQPRGKVLGGSTAISFQMYVRGQASDYDDWEKLGNKGWGFKDIFPYFKKHQHFDDLAKYTNPPSIPLETKFDTKYHGIDGPIHTSFSTWRLPIESDWIAASSTLGEHMGSPRDAWSGEHLGTFHSMSTIDRSDGGASGTRSYAVTGYFLPNAHHMLQKDGTATGVEFLHSGRSYSVEASKEIVLCASAIKSPQILELSGIGDPSVLVKAGVECLVENNRVGENFKDHIVSGFGYELVEGVKSLDSLQNEDVVKDAMTEYMNGRGGPLSRVGAVMSFFSYAQFSTPEEIATLKALVLSDTTSGHSLSYKQRLAENMESPNSANLQIIFFPASVNVEAFDVQQAAFKGAPNMAGKQGVAIATAIQNPLSVGSINITSRDPTVDPALDPAYMAHSADLLLMAKGYGVVQKMAKASPLKGKIKGFYTRMVDLTDKKMTDEYIKTHSGTQYHPCSTVAMGIKGEGACDDRLKVWGCKNPRIVDASVMPLHVSGNIVSTVYAIAEKGADLIKEDWGLI